MSVPKAPLVAGGQVAGLAPQSLDEAHRLSTALAMAVEMVPPQFRGKPEAVLAALLRGAEVGLSPMQALSSIAVINGRAALWGDAIPALILKAGHPLDVRLEGKGDMAVAIAILTRRDSRQTIERRFSTAEAKWAGLLSKTAPWRDYPMRMLKVWARSWAAQDGTADALMGLQIADEVLEYVGPDKALDVTPSAFTDPNELAANIRASLRECDRADARVAKVAAQAVAIAHLRDLDPMMADEVEAYAEVLGRELPKSTAE